MHSFLAFGLIQLTTIYLSLKLQSSTVAICMNSQFYNSLYFRAKNMNEICLSKYKMWSRKIVLSYWIFLLACLYLLVLFPYRVYCLILPSKKFHDWANPWLFFYYSIGMTHYQRFTPTSYLCSTASGKLGNVQLPTSIWQNHRERGVLASLKI